MKNIIALFCLSLFLTACGQPQSGSSNKNKKDKIPSVSDNFGEQLDKIDESVLNEGDQHTQNQQTQQEGQVVNDGEPAPETDTDSPAGAIEEIADSTNSAAAQEIDNTASPSAEQGASSPFPYHGGSEDPSSTESSLATGSAQAETTGSAQEGESAQTAIAESGKGDSVEDDDKTEEASQTATDADSALSEKTQTQNDSTEGQQNESAQEVQTEDKQDDSAKKQQNESTEDKREPAGQTTENDSEDSDKQTEQEDFLDSADITSSALLNKANGLYSLITENSQKKIEFLTEYNPHIDTFFMKIMHNKNTICVVVNDFTAEHSDSIQSGKLKKSFTSQKRYQLHINFDFLYKNSDALAEADLPITYLIFQFKNGVTFNNDDSQFKFFGYGLRLNAILAQFNSPAGRTPIKYNEHGQEWKTVRKINGQYLTVEEGSGVQVFEFPEECTVTEEL